MIGDGSEDNPYTLVSPSAHTVSIDGTLLPLVPQRSSGQVRQVVGVSSEATASPLTESANLQNESQNLVGLAIHGSCQQKTSAGHCQSQRLGSFYYQSVVLKKSKP